MPLSKKVALVTGASRGIGKAIFQHLAGMGATVIGTATSEEGCSRIRSWQEKNNIAGHAYVLDLSSRDSIFSLAETVFSNHAAVSILVNNAGVVEDTLAISCKDHMWEKVIDINLTGTFLMTRALLRPMIKQRWGRIINISSVVASLGSPGQVNYCAAKAGIEGMTRALAREVASRGITVNAVAPGCIETDMLAVMTEDRMKQIVSEIPLGRLGKPEEISSAVGFLASPFASYITGTVIHVNGGLYL